MYCRYFNLEKKPFQISSDNKFLWLGKTHAAALKLLKKGLAQNKSLLVLTGDIGTGKTTLINEIIHTLDPGTMWVKIVDPCFEMEDLFRVIAQAFGFEAQYDRGKNFSLEFFSFLNAAGDEDKKIRVIVDEAQRMPEWFLKEVISWSGFRFNRVLTVILAGHLEFEHLLRTHLGQAWKDHVNLHACLEPLNKEETKIYINKRLELAGTNRKIFLSSALHEAYTYSKGIPRLINISCDQALIAAFAKGVKTVDASTFRKATGQLYRPVAPPENKEHNEEELPKEDHLIHDRQRIFKIKIAWTALAACLCLFIGDLLFTGYTPSTIKYVTFTPPEIGLGYTPAETQKSTTLSQTKEDTMTEPTEFSPGKDTEVPPDSFKAPEPDAVIDWLIEKRKLKQKGFQ
ncbi:AAA family ATPase [Desulfobacula sp.]|uniref:ExeA family protein n=1 Tax=Desulfobacula sp. TaxID=2593537 RepID=UPI002604BD5E|nr:AAA family ATPase [Desulfobacula sp.]